MKSMMARLAFAGVLSLLGILLTLTWYNATTPPDGAVEEKAIAYLEQGSKDIERKLIKRVVWQLLKTGDPLYAGDAVRTPSRGSGQITFLDSETRVELEADSLIVLEEAKDGVTMNLVSGGLLLRSAGQVKGSTLPKIKAGKTQVALSAKASEMTLNVNEAGKGSISVTKGEVKAGAAGQDAVIKQGSAAALSESGVSEKSVISVIAPQAHAQIDIGPEGKWPLSISWQPLRPGLDLYFAWGRDRAQVQTLMSSRQSEATGSMQVRLPVGEYFWQLVAYDPLQKKEEARSALQKLQVISLRSPLLLKPAAKEKIALKPGAPLQLQWAGAPYFSAYELQISRAQDFAELLHRERLEGLEASWSAAGAGLYHWRVIAAWGKDNKPIASPPSSFTLEELSQLKPPSLTAPLDQFVHASDSQDPLSLVWKRVAEAKQYRVLVKKRRVDGDDVPWLDQITTQPQLSLKNLAPGLYTWTVRAEAAAPSAWAEARLLRVKEVATLRWADGESTLHFFETEAPSVDLKWQKVKAGSYHLRYAALGADWDQANSQAMPLPEVKLPLEKEGAYRFQVELRDDYGEIIARSSERSIEIKPVPPLPPPRLDAFKGQPLQSAKDGSISLTWRPVKDALRYEVALEDLQTGTMQRQAIEGHQISYSGLKPGRYRLHTQTINRREQAGEPDKRVEIEVPQTSDIQAPKVKKINIR